MSQFIIIGNGPYARMMKRYIALTGTASVAAYAVDAEYIQEEELDGLPVISFEDLKENFSCNKTKLIMGIGYTQMGNVRKKIFEKCKCFGYCFENYIHPTAIIEKNVALGEGNNILEGVILEESVILGDSNLLFGGSLIAHETVIGNYNTFSVKSVVAGCAMVGHNCFVGAAATVRDHVILNDYVLVGAAAYVCQDMTEYSVVVPAKSMVLEDRKSTEFL